ncbi:MULTISPECIES: DUF4756 family protein [Enterobacteriaceae]|uniref:DUF4756 family protein n=1 Tax=Enterobacteriaceae TaxID=543 RepID=UPI001F0F4FA4|nr:MULTISPECIES: DUF4756 family protein [Enterobacteriaceae]MCH4701678.1 DUF4756 family protein [Escherichia coli]MCH4719815.1 DUF4756 family protein [Escherichia coli]MCH4737833.1 DUF4756 family protein [Escherichia coli]MEB8021164.1 DUF4756 family protein [Raoultella ornithinolytica]
MRKVKLDNSDLLEYFDTIEKLEQQPSMDEYKEGYRKLRNDDAFEYEIKKYRSAHTELRRLDKKRQSLMGSFIGELNPISFSTANTSAKSSGDLDKFYERSLYRKAIQEKSDEEIVSLIIKQRTEAALQFQRSVEQSLEQLSSISSEFGASNTKRRKMAV